MTVELFSDESQVSTNTAVGEAVLTEAVRHVDIIHTSLAGMTCITLVVLSALVLPIFGLQPVTATFPILVMAITVLLGIGVLYYMNYQVHRHVANQAALTEVLVNSLGQAFLSFNRSGVCGSVYSQACLSLLEMIPTGKNIVEVLRIPDENLSDFRDWLDVLYLPNHALGFDDVVNFFPQSFPHSGGRRIALVYRPIRNADGMLKEIVLIATDKTDEFAAVEQAHKKEVFADMVSRVFRDRNQFHVTLSYLRDFIVSANNPELTLADLPQVLRQIHTLKAAMRHFSLLELGDIAQKFESVLRDPAIKTDQLFRQKLLDGRQKMSDALDVVLTEFRSVFGNENDWGGLLREIDETDLYKFAQKLQQQGGSRTIIRSFLQDVVAIPIQDTFKTFERDLFDLVNLLNKNVYPIVYKGSNPKVLTLPMQDFLFSLSHISRNIADHGIEASSTRHLRGKDNAGRVVIEANVVNEINGEWLVLSISDDGNGIDPKRVKEKLSIIDPEGSWMEEADQEVIQHVFNLGFSTHDGVTELSGRGVGMDAVEFEVKKLGGMIEVFSVFGKGTRFEIRLPYNMDLGFFDKQQGSSEAYGQPVVERPKA